MSKSDDQLRLEIEANESRGVWGGWAVVAGLVLEIVLATAKSLGYDWPNVENWGAVAADSLIALGVYAEIHFGRKASRGNVELRRRSDEKVAAANERAAQANERAEAAALELAKFRAPRKLTPEQSARIAAQIEKFSGISFAVCLSSFDEEIVGFATELISCLMAAKWKIEKSLYSVEGRFEMELWLVSPVPVSVGRVATSNVSIAFSSNNERARAASEMLVRELKAAGIEAARLTTEPNQPLLVLIGPKR
jgi:hypothetical protein